MNKKESSKNLEDTKIMWLKNKDKFNKYLKRNIILKQEELTLSLILKIRKVKNSLTPKLKNKLPNKKKKSFWISTNKEFIVDFLDTLKAVNACL